MKMLKLIIVATFLSLLQHAVHAEGGINNKFAEFQLNSVQKIEKLWFKCLIVIKILSFIFNSNRIFLLLKILNKFY
jgi:hypothetical protein